MEKHGLVKRIPLSGIRRINPRFPKTETGPPFRITFFYTYLFFYLTSINDRVE
jgi:hypothetical protein